MGIEAGGAWPQMSISVDGQNVATREVRHAGFDVESIRLDLKAGSRTIRIGFINDYWANPIDRNLFVQSYELKSSAGASLGSFNATQVSTRSAGVEPESQGLYSGGDGIEQSLQISSNGTYRFDIDAQGQYAGGAWPQMKVSVDGQQVALIEVNTAAFRVFPVTTSLKAGAHTLQIAFTNDYWVSPLDRNLFVDKVDVYSLSTSPAPTPTPTPPTPVLPPANPDPSQPPRIKASLLSSRVLVIYNSNSAYPQSKQVADYYIKARVIPASNLCPISFVDSDKVDFTEYDQKVVPAVKACLDRLGRQNILYMVSTFQTPYYMTNHRGQIGSSMDSSLEDIWDTSSWGGWAYNNPYYAGASSAVNYYPNFESLASYRARAGSRMVYSVFRLDARTAELAKAQVDHAIAAETNGVRGTGCFDRRMGDIASVSDSDYGAGDWDIYRAAEFTRKAGFSVIEDQRGEVFGSGQAPARCDNALFYAGWYQSNYNDVFTWAPGSIGFHTQSYSATAFRSGLTGSWAAGALERGITVSSGPLDEPYLNGVLHPDGVYRTLFQGATVGDAFLRNIENVKWQVVNFGDPLYQPFPMKAPNY
jgi:uncharacterized protein (TIGR03790 family)